MAGVLRVVARNRGERLPLGGANGVLEIVQWTISAESGRSPVKRPPVGGGGHLGIDPVDQFRPEEMDRMGASRAGCRCEFRPGTNS